MITEYYTANHDDALVVLSSVNQMHFKRDANAGYHIRSTRGHDLGKLLDHAVDFRIQRIPSGTMTFQLLDGESQIEFVCTAHAFRWGEFILHVTIIQRFMRSRLWKRHANGLNLRKLSLFKKISGLPDDVIHRIIVSYIIEPTKNSNLLHQLPIRRVETKSFNEISSVVRE